MSENRGRLSFEHTEERDAIRATCAELAASKDLSAHDRLAQLGKLCAEDLVPRLLDALEAEQRKTGSALGEALREATKEHFLAKFEGRSLLAHKVSVQRVGLWFGDGFATADVRLEFRP